MDNKSEQSNDGFIRIEPLDIKLSDKPSSNNVKKGFALKHSPLIWLGLGVLLTSALVVIFLLPRWISKPEGKTVAPVSSQTVTPVATSVARKDAISPWEKAQESRLRKETQDILSEMLEAQKILSEKGVEFWAEEKYTQAMEYAKAGDELYNQRDFVNSRTQYEEALAIFARLVEKIDIVFEETMTKGNKALDDGDATAAKAAFELALAIDAIDRNANIGRSRAESLDEVISLLKKGDDLLDQGQLEGAKAVYQQALDLDDKLDTAKQKIALVDERSLDRLFNRHMSAGFVSLENGQLSEASKSFNAALKLKPRSAEARHALEQASHKLKTSKINSLLTDGRELEAQEKWHSAVEKYEAALKLDDSLAEAQQGQQRADLRSKIHDKIEQILAQAERIYDAEVYAESLAFKNKLSALSDQGVILKKQLAALDKLLAKANTPVDVSLRSDNLTLVTLRKVGELGYFNEKNLSLRPGTYVAVGIREGYRDARVSFKVNPDKPLTVVSIQAAEKIALGK